VREKPGGRLRGCEVIAFGMCGKNHGLCNLLFGLCTTVIRGWWHTSHVVVVDSLMRSDFADDRVRAVRTSSLLDMDAFRAYVLDKYGVNVVLRDQVRVEVSSARWGHAEKGWVDVTEEFRRRFELVPRKSGALRDGQIEGYESDQGYVVPKGTDFNSLGDGGDPCAGFPKRLDVFVKVRTVWGAEWTFRVSHAEESIRKGGGADWILRGEGSLPWNFAWINTIDSQKFDDLLEHIILKMPPGFSLPPVSGKVSVLHVRVEEDYIKHVSTNLLHVSPSSYRSALVSAWSRAILTSIPRTDTVVVLSYLIFGNPVLAFLQRAGYRNIVVLRKQPKKGREVNAVADLIAGVELCNHVFIGCWSHTHLRGSTFSYVIARHLKARSAPVKLVFLDSEQIMKNPRPEVYTTAKDLR
jgi:hypothetical protein